MILSLILFALVIVIDLVIEISIEIVEETKDNSNITMVLFSFNNKYVTYSTNYGICSMNVLKVAVYTLFGNPLIHKKLVVF